MRIRRILRIIGIGFFLSAPGGWGFADSVQPDRFFTLEDSIRLATNNSHDLLMAHEDEEIALQHVHESEALFFPKLDLNANWSKFSVSGQNPLLLQPSLGPTIITNNPQENYYTARANIYQPVYEGGRIRDTWRQARIAYERARSVTESLNLEVENNAKQAFYDLLFAQQKAREYNELLQQAQTSDNRREGLSLSERLALEEELEILRTTAAQAGLEEQQAQLAYLHALNLELNTPVVLKGDLSTHPVDIDLQKMLAWAGQYRSELRQTQYQEQSDALGISLSLAERTPTVGFGATYEKNGYDLGLHNTDWAGTLNVNLPLSISDMFYGWAKVREHRSQYRQATLKYAQLSDQIQLQVREAFTKYRFWQDELTPREKQQRRLEELVTSLRGTDTKLSDRLKAEHVLVDSRIHYWEAVHGHLTALASLERAVGHGLDAAE